MRVTRLIEQDFMRIVGLDIRPGNKSLVILKGPNKSGKTSAMTGLLAALRGKKHDPEEPINSSSERSKVQIHLGDEVADRLKISATWSPKTRSLSVKRIDDSGTEIEVSSPQGTLNELVGALSFDPLKFINSKGPERLKMLVEAAGVGGEYAQLQDRRQQFYDKRRQLGREEKEIKIDPDPDPGRPDLEAIDAKEISERLKAIQKKNQERIEKLQKFQRLKNEIPELEENITRLEQALRNAEENLIHARDFLAKRKAGIEANQAAADELRESMENDDSIQNELREANEINAIVAKRKAIQENVEAKETLQERMNKCTIGIERTDDAARQLLVNSQINRQVPGLAITSEGEVLLNDLPFNNASGREQLNASCAIAMSSNPKVHVMCIDEGDRLDPEGIEELKRIAEENKFQVWLTSIWADSHADSLVVNIQDGQSSDAPVESSNSDDEIRSIYPDDI